METTQEVIDQETTQTTFSIEPMSALQTRAKYDQLILEGKQRAEQAYIDDLKAQSKQIYAAQEVADRFGIAADPTWTQKDLQHHMAVGDVLYPIQSLCKKASEIHRLYVVKGRDGVKAIMNDIYASFVKAQSSEHKGVIYRDLRVRLVGHGKKLKEGSTDASVIIRSVFFDFDDKQVHVYGKALEIAFFKNVAVIDFPQFVGDNGGWEGLRQLAVKELPKTAKQLEEAAAKATVKASVDQTLNDWWELQRAKPQCRLPLNGVPESFEDGKEVILRAYVKDGKLCVYWFCADEQPVVEALSASAIRRCETKAKSSVFSGVTDAVSYMRHVVEWDRNPPPSVADRREAEAAGREAASAESGDSE